MSVKITPAVLQVLLSLSEGPSYAYRIMKDVSDRSDGRVSVGPGALHFTLGKLEAAGWISEEAPPPDEDDARRKYYALTTEGRATLADELGALASIVDYARRHDLLKGSGEA